MCKFYGEREVLHEVSLRLNPREIVTLIGPNGAGKTTLLKCLLGLESADYGEVIRAEGLRIGYVPQQFKPQPSLPMTVGSFLTLYQGASTEMRHCEEAVRPTWQSRLKAFLKLDCHVAPLLAMTQEQQTLVGILGIEKLLNQPLDALSGGELRRVLLLRALLKTPQLLILDEPTAGVDVAGQGELYRLLKRLAEELHLSVLMVSHDLHVVMAGSERVICLNHHVCCEGTPQEVGGDASFRALFGEDLAKQLALYHHHHTHAHGLGDEDYPHTHHHAHDHAGCSHE